MEATSGSDFHTIAEIHEKTVSGTLPSPECSTTGVTKAVVCVILSVGWCI